MNKKCSIIITLLLVIIFSGVYRFMIMGDVSASQDGRMTIHLNGAERDLVLTEMRTFLLSVQQITDALAEQDMPLAIQAAKRVGRQAQAEVPMSLMGKLPLEFKKLGFDTHQKFDQLAYDVAEIDDRIYTLKQLSELMQNCVACHATYRLEADSKQ